MLPISRRTVLGRLAFAGAAALCTRCAASESAAAEQAPQLGEIARSKGILFGSLLNYGMLPDDARAWPDTTYAQRMLRQCDIFTCHRMGWGKGASTWKGFTEPIQGQFNLSEGEKVVSFARTNDKKVRCHSLVWYALTPDWFGALDGRQAAISAMRNHIHKVAGAFAGKVHSWDVVNEALHPEDGLPGGLRKCVFTDLIGLDWMHFAFEAAREADPAALLTYNEYNVEWTRLADCDQKRVALLNLLDDFRKRGTPIDAVGIQSHLYYGYRRNFDEDSFAKFLSDVAARNVRIFLTELDVIDSGSPSETEQRDPIVAEMYKSYLSVALANPAVTTVVCWGLIDREAWQNTNAIPTFRRNDETAPRPLPFDADWRPKAAAYAIAQALEAAPQR